MGNATQALYFRRRASLLQRPTAAAGCRAAGARPSSLCAAQGPRSSSALSSWSWRRSTSFASGLAAHAPLACPSRHDRELILAVDRQREPLRLASVMLLVRYAPSAARMQAQTPARAASCDCESPSAVRISRTQPARGRTPTSCAGRRASGFVISVRCCHSPRRGAFGGLISAWCVISLRMLICVLHDPGQLQSGR